MTYDNPSKNNFRYLDISDISIIKISQALSISTLQTTFECFFLKWKKYSKELYTSHIIYIYSIS